MPTPVSSARKCLTEEAARALDDAVAVARRRCHAQTTSLHAVSALLALPSSSLREACSRARTSAYSPRLHFRALELSVGVSLDRLPSSKTAEEPLVSNSLMAAIKRSQANQRRQPESFHFHQLHNEQQTTLLLKVELKHLIFSILDDPLVSRVLGEAGYRSCDIKLAIIHPPIPQSCRFSRARCPPIFLCNLIDSDMGSRNFSFPFTGRMPDGDADENCRRIGEILVRKNKRNPLLLGVCSTVALQSFIDCVQKGKSGVFPEQISGLSMICISKEISDFLNGGGSEENLGLKFKEVGLQVEKFSGPGVAVNYGELSNMVGDDLADSTVGFVVSKLTDLLKLHSSKLWLVGASVAYETYAKFLARFPATENDWDLHLLPITSSKSSFRSKSSLMGSFVPFGGFFPNPSDFRSPCSSPTQSFSRCHRCAEKYEQELAAIWKGGETAYVSERQSASLPAWLQMAELDTANKGLNASKTEVDEIRSSAMLLGLEKKWNDICQRLHRGNSLSKLQISATSKVESVRAIQFPSVKERNGEDSYLNEPQSASPNSLEKNSLLQQNVKISAASVAKDDDSQSITLRELSKNQRVDVERKSIFPLPAVANSTLPSVQKFVATDLRLGTVCSAANQNHRDLGFSSDLSDFKSLKKVLAQKVGRQDEAILAISEAISLYRSGRRRRCGSTVRGDIWLTFLGHDRAGKKKVAQAMAEVLFGSTESLICVDLGCQDRIQQSGSVCEPRGLEGYNVKFRGTLIVDVIAGELSKKPHSVVYLENVGKADPLAQNSLSQAIKTGKFPDSRGREIGINNTIFVVTSTVSKADQFFQDERKAIEFPEERILAARNLQMQLSCSYCTEVGQTTGTYVSITPLDETSNRPGVCKRKRVDCDEAGEQERTSENRKAMPKRSPMSYLDLNLPVEDVGEETSEGEWESDSASEDPGSWLEDFLNQVDKKIAFKPYNFDANAKRIMKAMELQVERVFGGEATVEIDYRVMVQILAVDWLGEKETTEAWIDQILHRSLVEARQKYHSAAHPVLKMCNSERVEEEQAPGTCLPARIYLN